MAVRFRIFDPAVFSSVATNGQQVTIGALLGYNGGDPSGGPAMIVGGWTIADATLAFPIPARYLSLMDATDVVSVAARAYLHDTAGQFVKDAPVYLGANGAVTASRPTGFAQVVGVGMTATIARIDLTTVAGTDGTSSTDATQVNTLAEISKLTDFTELMAQPEITETERRVTVTSIEGRPTVAMSSQMALSDRSSTIRVGASAQQAVPANTGRRYLFILNPASASETLWVSVVGSATINGESTGSIGLAIGQSFEWAGQAVPTNALSVVATTTAHAFTCYEG